MRRNFTDEQHPANTTIFVGIDTFDQLDCVPCNLASKTLLFGRRDDKEMFVVRCIGSRDEELAPFQIQAFFCQSIGVCPARSTALFCELCKGCLPDDVVVVRNDPYVSVVWFALNIQNKVAIIDITDWHVMPGMKVHQFACISRALDTRLNEIKRALHALRDSVELLSTKMDDGSFTAIQGDLKDLYDVVSVVV